MGSIRGMGLFWKPTHS
ncbi:hypothetical protein CSPAE12_11865 [Colletotrichum incanum]|nr:hypothetical protein CSPAE12_11865 [Colletotrichum incanum]